MKKVLALVGVVAVAAALTGVASANNGIAEISDQSSAYIGTTSVKNFVHSVFSNLNVDNYYLGSNTIVATSNTGRNEIYANDVEDTSQFADASVIAVEGETKANWVEADTTVTVDQEEECGCDEENLIAAVSDDSTADIKTDDTEESISTAETTEVVVQAAEQHNLAAADANTGDNKVKADSDVKGVVQTAGPSGLAVKFTGLFNKVFSLKVFSGVQ